MTFSVFTLLIKLMFFFRSIYETFTYFEYQASKTDVSRITCVKFLSKND